MASKDFAALKKTRATDKLADLTEKLEEIDTSKKERFTPDERFWKPTLDKSGNGSALIRFLPPPPGDGEDFPFVQRYAHYFQGPTGSWYVENSLTTFDQKDPVSEYNSKLWNTGTEPNKNIARQQKRKLNLFSNILVINDPKAPENNGKVFLYQYGSKIRDKINPLMYPEVDELTNKKAEPVYVFDFWEGANFKLVVRKVAGYNNYDYSEFMKPTPISDDDAEVEEIWRQQHSLVALVGPNEFKTYDELKTRLDAIIGFDTSTYGEGTTVAAAAAKPASQKKTAVAEVEETVEVDEETTTGDFSEDLDDLEDLAALIDD